MITGCAVVPAVLTATGFYQWEMVIFGLLQNQHPTPQPINKILPQVITSATPTAVPNLVHIRFWGFLGEWVKYNLLFLFMPPFFGKSPTGQTRRRIFAYDVSNDADSRKDVSFGVSLIWLHI